MGATKKYYLDLSEEHYNNLGNDEKMYLNHLGMQVKHIANDEDLKDKNYIKIRKHRIKAWNEEQKFLFNKRNN